METEIKSPTPFDAPASLAIGEDVIPTAPIATQAMGDNDEINEQMRLFEFQRCRASLQRLVGAWVAEKTETEVRRKTRKIEINVEELRRTAEIAEDETFIPVRTIDSNITKEQPPYINYLKNSRRIAIFKCRSKPNIEVQRLEEEFTAGLTYLKWETPYFKCLDGSQTHGWDSVEVVYDESKPLHVGLEHIGHDRLFYPETATDIEACPQLVREYTVSTLILKTFVTKFGFDPVQVKLLLDKRKNNMRDDETLSIYKRFFKYEGVVYVGWFHLGEGVFDWLKKPVKLDLGIKEKVTKQVEVPTGAMDMIGQPVMTMQEQSEWVASDIKIYPVVLLPYRESEEPTLKEYKGRCFLDEYKQEAQTAILSGFVNGVTRSTRVFGSPKQDDGSGNSLKELDNIKLANNTFLNKPVDFWSIPAPDPQTINALQYLDSSNANETNQVAFAVNNRQDSRKTAKEISSAEQQQSLLNGVQLTLFSTFVRSITSLQWLIVQSQAMQERIPLLLMPIEQPIASPLGGPQIDQMSGQPMTQTVFVNDIEKISLEYDIRAAGDVDVVQRQEKIQQMKQDWAVIQGTPLALRFLADLMKLEYPDSGEAYAQELMQMPQVQQAQAQVQALGTILEGVFKQHPEILQGLPTESQQQLAQIMGSIQKQPTTGQQQQKATQ